MAKTRFVKSEFEFTILFLFLQRKYHVFLTFSYNTNRNMRGNHLREQYFDLDLQKKVSENMNSILKLQDICFSYYSLAGETEVLKNITFDVKEGEFIAIVGPSGCGKSTLLNIICGLTKAKSGSYIMPEDISIGYMLQHDHLFEWRTIFENVTLGLEIQGKMNKENIEYVYSLLESYGVYEAICPTKGFYRLHERD